MTGELKETISVLLDPTISRTDAQKSWNNDFKILDVTEKIEKLSLEEMFSVAGNFATRIRRRLNVQSLDTFI